MKPTLALILITFITITSCISQDLGEQKKAFINDTIKEYPKPSNYVSDFEGILSVSEEQYLDSLISDYRTRTTKQMAVVTVSSISPYESIADFATDLGNYWGVGEADKDNGLVIVVSAKLRQIRLGSGTGTEKVLTDDILQTIINEEIVPSLRKGQYFEGIRNGILGVQREWN